MTLEELEHELGNDIINRGDGKRIRLVVTSPILPATRYDKESIVSALRFIRERMLLRIDDLICFAREEE